MDLEKERSGNSFKAGKGERKTEVWKLEALVDWEPGQINDAIWFIFYTLRLKCSLPLRSTVRAFLREVAGAEKSVVQRKEKIWTSWQQTWAWVLWLLMTLLCVFTFLLTVVFLVLLLFLISHGFYSIPFYFLHILCISFLFLPLWLFILCCLCYWKLRWNFQGFDCCTTKGQNYKDQNLVSFLICFLYKEPMSRSVENWNNKENKSISPLVDISPFSTLDFLDWKRTSKLCSKLFFKLHHGSSDGTHCTQIRKMNPFFLKVQETLIYVRFSSLSRHLKKRI